MAKQVLFVLFFCVFNLINFIIVKSSVASEKISLNCQIDLKQGVITGTAIIDSNNFLGKGQLVVKNVIIKGVYDESGEALSYKINQSGHLVITNYKVLKGVSKLAVKFAYKPVSNFSLKEGEFMGGNYIEKDFLLLMTPWHPYFEEKAIYDLTVEVPGEILPISEADLVLINNINGSKRVTFSYRHKRSHVSLIAARFYVFTKKVRDITLAIYLLDDNAQLAKRLLKRLQWCLDFYESLLGPFPFKRFQVVENKQSSGLALPTLALIGRRIIAQPFVEKVSLPHELVHSWFGCSVSPQEGGGNWSEALTAYLADYLLAERDGVGKKYRHDILQDYKSYVKPDNAFPLISFEARKDRASKAIGYGKGTMLFHMLKNMVGDKVFWQGIQDFYERYKFKSASWTDLEEIFSDLSSMDLEIFFRQWLNRKDIPFLYGKEAIFTRKQDGTYKVSLTLGQKMEKEPYQILVPLKIVTERGLEKHDVCLYTQEQTFEIRTQSKPLELKIDPDFDLMRDLSLDEYAPSLSRLFGSKKKIIVLPPKKEKGAFRSLITFLRQRGFETVERKELKHSFLKKGDFLVLGKAEGRLEKFCGKAADPKGGFIITVNLNPFDKKYVVAHALSASQLQTAKVAYKLLHYGKYAFLRFKDGMLEEKKQGFYKEGIEVQLQRDISGIASTQIKAKWQLFKALKYPQIVYLGEKHDDMGIHYSQLEIIKALSKENKVAVGMEMFQKPFQKAIDEYLEGRIDERMFLTKTEYFKRWGYNYLFYRPIIEYCKKNSIPVIALNLPAEISKKIARKGLKALSSKEKRALPKDLDLNNANYRRLLKKIYEHHKEKELEDFESFFQAQIAWDETMAENISCFLEKHPDYQMIVLVGGGHVEYGYGIPSRVEKRMGKADQAIVLFNQDELDKDKADFFLWAPHLNEPFTAKLGVLLGGKKKLTIEKVIPSSPAYKGGLKKGDEIVKIDGKKIEDIYQLKLELFFKKRGDTALVTLKRRDKNGKTKMITLKTGPFEPVNWAISAGGFHSRK